MTFSRWRELSINIQQTITYHKCSLSLTTTINLITRFILPFLLYLLHVSTHNVLFTSSSSNSSSYKDIFLSSLSQGWLPSLITKDFLYQWLNLINISTTTWSLKGLFLHVDILLFNAIPCCKTFHSNTFCGLWFYFHYH